MRKGFGNRHLQLLCLVVLSCMASASCEKVIDVSVNNSTQKVVIEGLITNDFGLLSHTILVSKTSNFSSSNERLAVTGALVVVTDITNNIIDTLLERPDGHYVTQKILGISGHNYQLTAIVDGATYMATSKMPDVVPFDSLYGKKIKFFGSESNQFVPVFTDPIGTKNYYRFSIQVNDSLQNVYDAWDDLLSDGKTNSRPLFVNNEDAFKGFDTVTVFMNCTDKGMFDFFNTLENATGDGQTPANPLTNISNGALGYFGAITMSKRTIILTD